MEIDIEQLIRNLKESVRRHWKTQLGIFLLAVGITTYSLPIAIAVVGLSLIVLDRID